MYPVRCVTYVSGSDNLNSGGGGGIRSLGGIRVTGVGSCWSDTYYQRVARLAEIAFVCAVVLARVIIEL
jgi:hypothetical protein